MGILQARILEWVAILAPAKLPNPGIELGSPALQAGSLPSELPEKPYKPPKKHPQWQHWGVIIGVLSHRK